MATAHFASMGTTPNTFNSEFDMDTFIDFNQTTNNYNSPLPSSRLSLRPNSSRPVSNICNAPSPIDETEENQVFAGPSHEYDRFKQQVPVGVVASFPQRNQPLPSFGNNQMMGGFNSGIDDMSFGNGFDNFNGLDMDMDFAGVPSMPAMYFPPGEQSNPRPFVDPTNIDVADEPVNNVRLWPGMHQQQAQQAAMAKAQLQRQQQQQSKAAGKARAASYQSDPHTEESISRLLNQMRHGNGSANVSEQGDGLMDGSLPHIARMRKEEEDMDEDERLLASEEGKKLSSKERRQLRNKVSARAFRSRRKEYIGQLEGDLAVKATECNNLKVENQGLMAENARYRHFIETMLRNPAFGPLVNELSKDASFLNAPQPQKQAQHPRSVAPTPALSAVVPSQQESSSYQDFDDSRTQMPKQQETQHVGMTMVPEVDLSTLNLEYNNKKKANSNNKNKNNSFGASQGIPSFNFQPSIYQVRELPQGPSALDLALDSVRHSRQQVKSEYPTSISNNFATSNFASLDDNEHTLYSN